MKSDQIISLAFENGKYTCNLPYNKAISLRNSTHQMLQRRELNSEFTLTLSKQPGNTASVTLIYNLSDPKEIQPIKIDPLNLTITFSKAEEKLFLRIATLLTKKSNFDISEKEESTEC